MTRVRRRGTSRFASLAVLVALIVTTVTPTVAGSTSIQSTREEIARLSTTLSQEEKTSEITANEYDAAKVKLGQINAKITSLDARELQKRGAISVTAAKLAVDVVRAYVLGVDQNQIINLFNQNVKTSGSRKVYEDEVIGDLTRLRNTYESQKHSLDVTIAQVNSQKVKAQHQESRIQDLLYQNAHNESVTRATLAAVTRKLAEEIITYEITVGVAAARAHNIAGEEQAVAAASEVGGQTAANKVLEAIQAATPPLIREVAGTAQGEAALRAAETQNGRPLRVGRRIAGPRFRLLGPGAVGLGPGGLLDPAHDRIPVAGAAPRAAQRAAARRPALLLQPRRRPPGRPRRDVRGQRPVGHVDDHLRGPLRHGGELLAHLHLRADRGRAAVRRDT